MKRICAWCRTEFETDASGVACMVSHGICEPCKWFVEANADGRPLHELLASVPAPVLVVDASGRVRNGNAAALSMLGRPLDQMVDQRAGDLMECTHARLPGGCGETGRCASCGLRSAVMSTHETGRVRLGVTACLDVDRPEGARQIRFRITTVKKEESVLLRIDAVEPVAAEGLP